MTGAPQKPGLIGRDMDIVAPQRKSEDRLATHGRYAQIVAWLLIVLLVCVCAATVTGRHKVNAAADRNSRISCAGDNQRAMTIVTAVISPCGGNWRIMRRDGAKVEKLAASDVQAVVTPIVW